MARAGTSEVSPKTFFLNERQELSSFDREGGGNANPLVGIDWSERSARLSGSLSRAVARPRETRDPTAAAHHFVVAVPTAAIARHSTSKKAHGGQISKIPAFGGEQSKVFRKLGMDLIEVLPEGRASVHIPSSRVSQLLATVRALPAAGGNEQSRWVNVEEFQPLHRATRIDSNWLDTLAPHEPVETFVRLQPTLSRPEVQDVLQALANLLEHPNTRLLKAGREFSGRYWCKGWLTKEQLIQIADEFTSIQSIHPRYATHLMAKARKQSAPVPLPSFSALPSLPTEQLPTVAIVDTGIPEEHALLAPYRRNGYRNPDLDPTIRYIGNHGSTVASCAVFGPVDLGHGVPQSLVGSCRVMDVMIAWDATAIDDEALLTALDAVVATANDVRVFNLSFGGDPLDGLSDVRRREELIRLQDLDNWAFARDALLVIAAGNSPAGLVPEARYPDHIDDPRWALGSHARSFNGAVCGAYVAVLGANCVAGVLGAPSPFTRIGPGLCKSPVPGFSAPGGDGSPQYQRAPGTGVGVCNSVGFWEDHAGTSMTAPLVAREAAWVFQELARHCEGQTLPFAGTVKAWMHLAARRAQLSGAYEALAKRTLGRGLPTAARLQKPFEGSAVFIWQSVLQAPKNVSRVQFPVPLSWLTSASRPKLRLVAAWNTPANIALVDSWACRKVSVKVRPFGAVKALRGDGRASGAYPLVDREFDIDPQTLNDAEFELSDDLWVLEAEYEEVGEYPPAMTVSPQQRVGVVLELWDEGEEPRSPQAFVQASSIALELNRLSVLQYPIQPPVVIRQ